MSASNHSVAEGHGLAGGAVKSSDAETPASGAAQATPCREQNPIRLTVFALPKPFSDDATSRAQLNAVRSWRALGPAIEVLLLGDEEGIAETAASESVGHMPGVARNTQGTPLINSAFALAEHAARGDYLLYCNADVILRGPLVTLAEKLAQRWPAGFLGLGRRRDIKLDRLIDWTQCESAQAQLDALAGQGRIAARVCKEYFLFRRGQFKEIPAFAVGRGNWDNWMVANSRRVGWPVVDLSTAVEALHQEHDYSHLKASRRRPSRWDCYVSGVEAKENERLAGGKWLARGSSADWRISHRGELVKNMLSSWDLDFWLDLPKFLKLSLQLPFQR